MPTHKKTKKKARSIRNRMTKIKKHLKKSVTVSPEIRNVDTEDGFPARYILTQSSEILSSPGIQSSCAANSDYSQPSPPKRPLTSTILSERMFLHGSPSRGAPRSKIHSPSPLPTTISLPHLLSKLKKHLRDIKNTQRRKGPARSSDASNKTKMSDGSNVLNTPDDSSNMTKTVDRSDAL